MKYAKRFVEEGGMVRLAHPDDDKCIACGYTDSDTEQIFRLMERQRGLAKAAFPPTPFKVVRAK